MNDYLISYLQTVTAPLDGVQLPVQYKCALCPFVDDEKIQVKVHLFAEHRQRLLSEAAPPKPTLSSIEAAQGISFRILLVSFARTIPLISC